MLCEQPQLMASESRYFQADILVVDDVAENIRFLSDFLSKQGYQVRKAISGRAALNAVNAALPDLILLDINMAGIGGYEVCEILKKDLRTSSIPVIFLSAGSQVKDKIRAFEVGGVDYITKPFQLEEVLVRVQTQLTIQTLQKQLKDQNQQLHHTVSALQKAQSELIQQEKLVNAGRITAGISHEINNPLSFILGNLNPARDYSRKLINLVKLYQEAFPEANSKIIDFAEEVELDFLISDFENVTNSIQTGAERILSVVQALSIFSRVDESGIKTIDVHESLESILTLLRHKFTSKNGLSTVSIIKNYENVPLFLGHANLFNQALINLIQNAIDALELKIKVSDDPSFKPILWIQTDISELQRIRISIKDNGLGVIEKNQARLFEPFFTTKPVGKGVGLNLFTSYQIVTELHQGSLIYQDCPGGSEFIVEVPFKVV